MPESSRFLIKTFLKAVDFGDKNLVKRDGTVPTDTSTYVSDALNAATPDRASAEHFYGLGNLDEFAAEVMSDPEFQRFLLVIPDPTPDNPKRNLWQSIVDFFQKFLKEFGIDADIKDTLLETALRSVMDVVHEEEGGGTLSTGPSSKARCMPLTSARPAYSSRRLRSPKTRNCYAP